MSRVNYNESYRTTGGLQRFDCLAWVNFNGTGTVAIRAAGNVSSITDNGGSGDYTVNFTNALPDANYSTVGSAGNNVAANTSVFQIHNTVAPTISAVRIQTLVPNTGALTDQNVICVAVFR